MRYFITAMVEMTGSYDTEIEADSYEDAKAMAEEIVWGLDSRDVCWSDEVVPYVDVEVCTEEEEQEDEVDVEYDEGVKAEA